MPGLPPNAGDVQTWWSLPRAWLASIGISPDNALVMRVLGDSNFGSLGHGDIVLLDRRPRDGDGVYVLRFGDRVRIKRVQLMSDGSVKLFNDNAAYEPEYVDAAAFAAIEVIGFCFAALGRVL
jgi:phage repressor protein C with HTH and peptisase S24 domain